MIIELYRNNSAGEVARKDLTHIATKEVDSYNIIDIEAPSFILSDTDIEDLDGLNYVYIEELARYYEARVTLLQNNMYQVNCEVDPIMSFLDDILYLDCIINKQQYDSNMYLDDGSYITEERESVQVLNFSNGFNDSGRYILIASGG